MSKVLVTGGTGYIGSHTCVELLSRGKEVIILDNLSNSSIKVVDRINSITGKKVEFIKGDILDEKLLDEIFSNNDIDSVIHFAGLKSVGESVSKPIEYYTNNVSGSLVLFNAMKKHNVKKIVFSSSATVYGDPEVVPITEDAKVGGTTNPYGTSKLFIEQILKDIYVSDKDFKIVLLRYFNPIGAHKSGLLGEDPKDIPNNLLPYVARVAIGKLPVLSVYGNDYDTIDGTGVRDYIHVCDLAVGHIKALEKIDSSDPNVYIYNLGTGRGYSVLEVVKAFEEANNIKVNYKIVGRRPGDIAVCYADPTKAYNEIGFAAKYDINEMCKDIWNFQTKNPNGIE